MIKDFIYNNKKNISEVLFTVGSILIVTMFCLATVFMIVISITLYPVITISVIFIMAVVCVVSSYVIDRRLN